VTFKKAPLANAAITFFPTGNDAVRAAYGLTDESGKYSLMTPISGLSQDQCQGVVPGTYRVIVSKLIMADGTEIPKTLTTADALQQGAKESIPSKFSNEAGSVLKTEIQKETPRTDLNFAL